MKNYVQPADSIRVVAPYAVTPGVGMLVGALFCVAAKTAAAGEITDAVTEGVFMLPIQSADTATTGAPAYWDDANRRISASSGTAIGHFVVNKLAGETTTSVRLQVSGAVSGDGFDLKAAIGIVGQSNEAGATAGYDSNGVLQRYSAKAPSQGIFEPVKLQPAGHGSMFTEVAELLARDRIKVDLHNGAIGGASLYVDYTGFIYMGGRANSTAYRGKRAAGTAQNVRLAVTTNSTTTATMTSTSALVVGMVITGNANITDGTTVASITNATTFVLSAAATGTASSVMTAFASPNTVKGDRGHRGDLIYVSATTSTWEATTGNRHLVFLEDPDTPVYINDATRAGTYYSDPGVVLKETHLVTAGSPPSFPGSPAIGNTVVDGNITWTCISVTAKANDLNNVHVMRFSEDGFDPYYACVRLLNSLMSSAVSATKRFLVIQNGQSDAGLATTLYRIALQMIGQFFGRAPYYIQPCFGLSIYGVGQGQANWDLLETALSSGGIDVAPDYVNSQLTTNLVSSGYHQHVLGQAITNFAFHYLPSVYRTYRTNTESMLQPDGRHLFVEPMKQVAAVLAPPLSRIIRNVAA